MPQRTLILASSSPYRKALLARLMLPFETVAPNVIERPNPNELPEELVHRLAIEKATSVARKHPGTLIIGSDQVAVHDSKIVGKPLDHRRAVEQLLAASGKKIILFTGLALLDSDSNTLQSDVVRYAVQFRPLTRSQIENYLRKEQPYQCCGSVRADGLGIALLDRFEGDDPNALIGLPLIRLVQMLETAGIRLI